MPISVCPLGGGSPLRAAFPQDTTILLEAQFEDGVWGASESSIGVNKLSGPSLIHNGYWVTAKDPTVIWLSFFSAK